MQRIGILSAAITSGIPMTELPHFVGDSVSRKVQESIRGRSIVRMLCPLVNALTGSASHSAAGEAMLGEI